MAIRCYNGGVIDTGEKLHKFLPLLDSADWVALDTEADSLHAYPEKLCLIQFSIPAGDFLVDPLARMDFAPLWQALSLRHLIFHAADYDLRLLRKHAGFVPHSIFDTMIAARLAGCDKFGLTDLTQQFLGVTLEKGPQKADWARRPLSPRMEEYARNDTRFLKPLSDKLHQILAEKGRLRWLEESCAQLVQECSQWHEADPDQVWRIKGSHALGPHSLAVLRELWHWRDQAAIAANRPPYFILKHESLVDLALAAVNGKPVDPLIPPSYSAARRASLKAALQKGLDIPEDQRPQVLRRETKRMSEAERNRFMQLQQQRDRAAARLQLDPTLIASKSMLLMLAENWAQHQRILLNWQRELLE